MKISIKLLNGQVRVYELEPTDTVLKLKEMLVESEGIEIEQIRLILGGKPLVDNKTFEQQKVNEGSQIKFLLSMRGGY